MTPGNDALRRYLRAILLRTAALHAGAGLISFVAAISWLLLALILWTVLVSAPGLTAAVVVARAALVVAIGLFGYFVVWPLVRMPRLDQLASEIERRQDLKELVRAGFEFSRDETAARRYSPDLVKEVIRQAVERLSGLRVRRLFLKRRDLVFVPVALGGLIGLVAFALFDPSVIARAGRRVVSPEKVAIAPHRPNLLMRPGNVTVLAGSNLTVSGLDLGRSQMPIEVSFNLSGDFWKTEPTTLVRGAADGPDAFDHYDYTFRDLRNTISYYFRAGDYRSESYTITVVHEPILTDVRVTLSPPAYTGEAPVTLAENAGNVQALEGTGVKVEARSNNPLRAAWVQFDETEKQPVEIAGARNLSFEFKALSDGHYKVLLEDSLGFATRDPLAYTIEVFQDRAPTVDVLDPGEDSAMPRNQQLDIGFVAADDYGVARASLLYRKTGDGDDYKRVAVPMGEQKSRKEVAVAYRWDLTGQPLFPGNSIEYFIEVADNNVVTGPGIGRSRVFRVTVPTMSELYDTAHEEETHRDDALKTAIEQSRDLSDQLEKISREYLKTEKMDWSQKKELDHALEKQQSVEEKLNDVKQSLDQTLQEMSDNEMTSQQIGEKLEEIRDLLDQIDSNALKKYMEELRKAMDKMSPEDVKKALENLEVNADEMLKNLERTASLLKQLQKEQRMEDMVRQSQSLMEKQSQLNEDTEKASAQDREQMDELARRQEELARQAEELQKSAEKLSKEMDDPQVQNELQQMSQQMQQEGPQPHMEKASDQLSKQQQKSAMQEQQEALEQMVGLFKSAQHAQQTMGQNEGKKMAASFQKFAKQTLELSFRQESLASDLKNSTGTEEQSPQTEKIAQDQLSYLQATQKVADELMKMANASMTISPALIEAMGDAINRMQSSMLFLEQDKPFMSTAHAHNAVESLNEATIEMLRTAQSCSSSGQGGKPSSAMQMLQQMIPQQQDIVRETRSMMQLRMAQEALRQQQQAQLDRLAGQQRSLQEVAKQIQESLKNNREALGKLDRTIDEMEAVVNSLNQGAVDDELVNKEQRILSRLLDAERSVNSRDYEKQRESVTAADVFSKSLGKRTDAADAQSLRDEIQRAMQLKAPGEFEDLIRLYFRALAEQPAPDNRPRSQ